MSVGLAVEICALVLLVCLIVLLCYRNRLWLPSDKIFLFVIISATISAAADVLIHLTLEYYIAPLYSMIYVNNYFYFISRNLTPVFYLIYIYTLTSQNKHIGRSKVTTCIISMHLLSIAVLMITNPFIHGVFYYDEGYVYHRGHLLPILYGFSALIMVLSIIIIFKYRAFIEKDKQIAILLFFPISMGAVLVQMIFPSWRIEMFATALCIMMVMFTLQKKEEFTDGITNLWNRTRFIFDTHREIAEKESFTVVSIHIGSYNLLGRTLGFATTEKLITDISARISELASSAYGLYYLGDGSFEAIFTKRKQERAETVANKINAMLKIPWKFQGMELSLLPYIAISHSPEDFSDKNALIHFTSSFNKYAPYSGEIFYAKDFKMKLSHEVLEEIIENALLENKFEVYYQPIISSESGSFRSAEALLRLHDDKYGFIPPNEFIPVAENNASIIKIGQYVLESVCEFIKNNNIRELGLDFIEINLSVVQCMQTDLYSQILTTLDKYGVERSQINLEITETGAINSSDIMLKNMDMLSSEGIPFSLDDYGSGHANLDYVVSFPFSFIKLDRTLVARQSSSEKGSIALKYTIEMLQKMGFKIIAEGVETLSLAQFLNESGCNFQQGYYYSRPLPASDFLDFIKKYKNGMVV